MKKLSEIGTIILGLILFAGTSAIAQTDSDSAPVFQESDIVINAGLGLGSTYSWAGSLGLPFGAGVEYGITDLETGSIGVGGDFGMISGSGLTITYIGARGSYHFNELMELENNDLDLYGGLGLYYRNFSYSGSGSFGSGITAAFHVGTRYYFSENFGIYGELGNNWGWLNAGAIFRL